MFTVASMFTQMQDLCASFPVYIPGQDGNDTGHVQTSVIKE